MSCEDITENIATENDMQIYIEKLRERIQYYKDESKIIYHHIYDFLILSCMFQMQKWILSSGS